EVWLDVGMFVFDMEAGLHAVGDHARPIAVAGGRRRARDAKRKQQPDAIRSTKVEILADNRLEEVTALHGPIKDLRETDLELTDGQAMVVACRAVGRSH